MAAELKNLLFYNAKLWVSGKGDKSWMIVDPEKGIVVDIGSDLPPKDKFSEDQTKDCGGRRILPGIHDSHLHVSYLGDSINSVDLQQVYSIEDLQSKVRAVNAGIFK